ncbi:hypothetical protein A2865_02410 [Candidatus Woesebacteria bacterium RIFCSPHIGHO2_01_FULL_39_17]|uniref:Uncharacterized protein n=2 Tax=Candidatus Woeseibacteriota TaxID=1752722 RepID=A0A0G0LRH6_9BACT|nr:MAG: hypothetical protein UT19_C0009G0036 [Candidatus Woesebacteria bacterium GW2011_GWB1_39_10b]OGM24101.1 MAG: hypothetical protein A2865_02410 [Candidatus Woesebacteria bacterium RIFCSPHIGHO2_01_FULL_39_17]OGM62877.1 MAG: hypothetical protein A3A52_03620 [Candidatus Woesebacteria bacterium RIFCSPLOWO2_01_FULL_39_14]
MENFEGIAPSVFTIVKIAVWIFLLLYILFAGVVIKQIRVMTETLEVGFEKQIKVLGIVHFLLAVIVFLLSLVVL